MFCAGASRAGRGAGALCRRAGRLRRRRDRWRRRRDAAELIDIDYEILPSVTDTAEAAEGKIAVWDECPDNISNLFETGNKAATDAAFAERRAYRQAALCDQPGLRAFHGAARRDRRVGPGRGPLHALCRRAVPAPGAAGARDPHLQDPGEPHPGHRRRCRRRVRHQGLAVSRAPAACCSPRKSCAGRSSGPASAARRSWPTSMPATTSATPSWRSTRTGRFLGAAGQDSGQCRRLHLVRAQSARDLRQCRHADRRLRHPGGACVGVWR